MLLRRLNVSIYNVKAQTTRGMAALLAPLCCKLMKGHTPQVRFQRGLPPYLICPTDICCGEPLAPALAQAVRPKSRMSSRKPLINNPPSTEAYHLCLHVSQAGTAKCTPCSDMLRCVSRFHSVGKQTNL